MAAQDFDMEKVKEIEQSFGKGTKKPVDDHAPKRALSAYFLFSNKMRPQLLKDHAGEPVSVIGKEISVLWNKLSAGEKAPFEKKSAAEKKTYHAKLAKYQKTSNYKKHQMNMLAYKIYVTKKPFRKDPNAVKRPLSAYMIYSSVVRKQIVKDNPDHSVVQVIKEQSAMWNALGDSEKKKWSEKAAAEKKKYEGKLAKYMKTSNYKKYIEERDQYKADMKIKRNKLMGIKKRPRKESKGKKASKSPVRKKAKKRSGSKASKSRSRSRKRRSSKRSKSRSKSRK